MICRTLAEIRAAARAEHDGPLTQDQADLVAAILATAPQPAASAA
jgi:hypothetical protein